MNDSQTIERDAAAKAAEPEPWAAFIGEARAHAEGVTGAVKEIVALKVERAQVAVVRGALTAVTLIIAGTLGVAALITATVLFVQGSAGALALAFGGRPWAGNLAAGFLWVALACAGWAIARAKIGRGLDRAHAKKRGGDAESLRADDTEREDQDPREQSVHGLRQAELHERLRRRATAGAEAEGCR